MALNTPRDTTIRRVFAVSMNRCAFPGCSTPVIDPESKTILGEICHIHAQREKGPRFEPNQGDEERHGFDNLILMCSVHHKIIDAHENLAIYTADQLRALKRQHEQVARTTPMPDPALTDALLASLSETAAHYEGGAVHMNFTNSVFRVGGEGGGFGGGGGSGGVLTIVGTTRVPPEARIDRNGGDGQAPGGGGGGAGAVTFVGRPVDTDDLANGLRVSSLFAANATSLYGLFNVLGGGWEYLPVPSLDQAIRINLVAVLEFGSVAPDTLIRIEIQLLDPQGAVVLAVPRDVAVPTEPGLTPRVSVLQVLEFDVSAYGVWNVVITSSNTELSRYPLECRQGTLP